MAKYKVSSLYMNGELVGKYNKIFRSGDEITEKEFPEGNFDKLVKDGWIEEVEEVSGKTKTSYESNDSNNSLPDIAEMTIKEVTEWASGVEDVETLNSALDQVDTKGGKKAIEERLEDLS